MPTATLSSVQMHYEISGDGPPLLLIGGMLSDSASWTPLVPFLEPHFTVIRPDNRATGRTTPVEPFAIPDCADDLIELLDQLNLGPVHVAGHSMGGFLALILADKAPHHVATMTSICSAPMNAPRNFQLFTTALKIRKSVEGTAWLEGMFPWFMTPAFFKNPAAMPAAMAASEAYPYAQTTQMMEQQIDALTRYDASSLNPQPKCPMQAILADGDLLFPEPIARKILGRMFGDENVHTVEKAGHSIHWEQPAQVAELIQNFTSIPA